MTTPASTPPGWYADPVDATIERYYDGTAWTPQVRPRAVEGSVPAAPPVKKKKRKVLWIVLGVIGALILISAIGKALQPDSTNAADAQSPAAAASPSDTAAAEAPAASPEPPSEATETTEPTTAPQAPAAEPGSVANPLPQPYVAKGLLGGEKYSLTASLVNTNANEAVHEWNQFNSEAPAGFKYVIVELTMTALDPDGVEPLLASFDLQLATGEGNTYSSEIIAFGEGMPSMSDGPKLYPGNSFTGYAAYIVPESAEAFLLMDNRKYVAF